mmetsp:Transcript_21923/g.45670  ORF Transcript_21923/g.45670 Transcript_21923/m.45670 type:complete len:173 (-) Transcript_21923:42-560(-)
MSMSPTLNKGSDGTDSTDSNNTAAKEKTLRVDTENVEVGPNEIELKFVFANRDGTFVSQIISLDKTVLDMKKCLKAKWPVEVGECPSFDRMRMICMGRGILNPDDAKLSSFDIPKFSTHSTPINCSVRPVNATPSVGKGRNPQPKSAPAPSATITTASGGTRVDSRCSCIIL